MAEVVQHAGHTHDVYFSREYYLEYNLKFY